MIWRVAMAKMDTLSNIKSRWTLDDVYDACEILDMKSQAEEEAMRKVREQR